MKKVMGNYDWEIFEIEDCDICIAGRPCLTWFQYFG